MHLLEADIHADRCAMEKRASTQGRRTGQELLMFQVSGGIGTVLFLAFYELVVACAPLDLPFRPALCFGFSYFVRFVACSLRSSQCLIHARSIFWQHALHRHLVFGATAPYLPSLLKTYAAYTVSIVLSPIMNEFLVSYVGLSETLAWGGSTAFLGVLNYFVVGKAAFGR